MKLALSRPMMKKKLGIQSIGAKIRQNYELYLLILPSFIYIILFHYVPMYGVQIAFKDFIAAKGIMASPWIGFDNFSRFFSSYYFGNLIKNTLGISIYHLVVGFPIPIILALMLNEVRHSGFKRLVQTVTYAPHFISTVVLVGMMVAFLAPRNGLINQVIVALGGQPVDFMARPEWFKTLYVFSGVWQGAGWGSIVFLSAISGIDPQLYEAAVMDGATKFQKIWYIDLPGIMPTAVIMLIMNVGRVMSVGFEKAFLMQNAVNISSSEVISTYVYKMGLLNAEYSFSSAVGLFNSVINFILLITVNAIAKRVGETSLW